MSHQFGSQLCGLLDFILITKFALYKLQTGLHFRDEIASSCVTGLIVFEEVTRQGTYGFGRYLYGVHTWQAGQKVKVHEILGSVRLYLEMAPWQETGGS